MIAFPEGTEARATDDRARLLKKWNQILFTTNGNVGTVPFPEGTEPMPQDSPARSETKINAILATL
jgi:hypothetical protein